MNRMIEALKQLDIKQSQEGSQGPERELLGEQPWSDAWDAGGASNGLDSGPIANDAAVATVERDGQVAGGDLFSGDGEFSTSSASRLQSALTHADPKTVWTSPPNAVDAAGVPATTLTFGSNASPLERAARDGLEDLASLRQYRELADNLVRPEIQNAATSIAMLSVDSGSHTAETLARVALLLAERDGHEVLLVDGNTTGKALSVGFEQTGWVGLVDVLAGRATWEDAVVSTAVPNLNFLAGGRGMLSEGVDDIESFEKILAQWKERWSVVLIDAGRAGSASAGLFAKASDATYLLVRMEETDQSDAEAALAWLENAHAAVLGCIVTNAPPLG